MAIESSGLYPKSFQQSLLGHILRCPRLLRQLSDSRIGSDDFPIGIHKAILNAGAEVLRVAGSVPDNGVTYDALMNPLRAMILAQTLVRDEHTPLIDCLQYIFGMELQPEYYENAMAGYLMEVRSQRVLNAPSVIADPAALVSHLSRVVETSRSGRRVVANPLLDVQIGDYQNPVPCGLQCIDGPMHGGLDKGRTGIICGFTGLGKTAVGLQFTLGAASLGFRARFATLELPLHEIRQRAYANAAHYDYNSIQYAYQSQAATEEEREAEKEANRLRVQAEVAERIRERMGDTINNFGIYDFAGDTCTVTSLEQMIIDDEHAGNPLDMLVVDWLELVDLPVYDTKNQSRAQQVLALPIRELRHKLEEVTKKLAQLSVRHNLAMWILTQADFKAEGQSIVGLGNKSEGKGVSRHVSWFLGFGMSEDDRRANEGRGICHCHAGKGRNGAGFTARVRRMLHEQRFESMETLEEEQAREELAVATAGFH